MKTLFAAALIFACSAQAQTVWRCGPEGRSYADKPCADGREVAVTDTRDAAALQAAREVAEREHRLADKLVRDREREHAEPAHRAVPRSARAKPVAPLKARPKPRRAAEGDDGMRRAVVPAS
jgi:hypothetical protein